MEGLKNFLRTNKWIKILLLLVMIYSLVVLSLIIKSDRQLAANNPEIIVVLGAGLNGDIPSQALVYRLDACVEQAEKYPEAYILVTGGQGPNEWVPEAIAMKDYLVEQGVLAHRVLVEDQSTSTFENLLYGREVLGDYGIDFTEPCRIISNQSHLFRSLFLAKRLGFRAEGVASPLPASIFVQSYVREVLAVFKSFIWDRL